jgi:hypothetical protein
MRSICHSMARGALQMNNLRARCSRSECQPRGLSSSTGEYSHGEEQLVANSVHITPLAPLACG